MKRKILVSILSIICALSVFAQTNTGNIRVGVLNGPTCIPAAYLMENLNSASFEKFADPQALLPKMIKKEIDVGFMPLNVAAKVYNSGNKVILCCAVTGYGNLSLITKDQDIKRFSDLKGKTINVAGQGATPEYLMRYILEENNLNWKEGGNVTLDYSIPTAQIVAQLAAGKISYAVVPEPFTTIAKIKSASILSPLDLQKEYLELTGVTEMYPLSVMVVRKDFAEENPELIKAFLDEYKKAYEWTVHYPDAAGRLTEKHSLGLAADVVTKAIPVSNYTFKPANEAVSISEDLLSIFLKCEPSSIGGKLPDRDFYYEVKQMD